MELDDEIQPLILNVKAKMEHVLESGNEVTAERCRLECFVLALLEMTAPGRDAPDDFRNRRISYEFLI